MSTKQDIAALDGAVPEAAGKAFREEQEAALAAGRTVTIIEGEHLVELHRVGGVTTRQVISNGVRPSHRVQSGARFSL